MPKYEFHISRQARQRFDIAQPQLTNIAEARRLAQQMNVQRDLIRFPEQTARASELNALGLMNEVFQIVIGR